MQVHLSSYDDDYYYYYPFLDKALIPNAASFAVTRMLTEHSPGDINPDFTGMLTACLLFWGSHLVLQAAHRRACPPVVDLVNV